MQSEGSISFWTLSGSTWTDKSKLEANEDGTFSGGITTAGGIVSNYGNITSSTASISSFGNITYINGSIAASQGSIGGKTISSTSTITSTASITGGSISTSVLYRQHPLQLQGTYQATL